MTYREEVDKSVDFSIQIKEKMLGAKLSAKAINNLPDSDFAYIAPGGKKDSEGKTTPRSLRHLPIPDAAHVRNALARLNQTHIPAEAKKKALSKITRKAKELGVHVSKSDGATDKSKQEKLDMKDIKKTEKTGPNSVTNALFVGSTHELQKFLKCKVDTDGGN